MVKGYKLAYGIWNYEHSITSRDIGRPEIYKTKSDIDKVLQDKKANYASMGYELWFTKTTEVDVVLCGCGKHSELNSPCWWCGEEI